MSFVNNRDPEPDDSGNGEAFLKILRAMSVAKREAKADRKDKIIKARRAKNKLAKQSRRANRKK